MLHIRQSIYLVVTNVLSTSFMMFHITFNERRVYSAGENFTGKRNPALILPVKLKFYQENKSFPYSTSKT